MFFRSDEFLLELRALTKQKQQGGAELEYSGTEDRSNYDKGGKYGATESWKPEKIPERMEGCG